MEIRVEESYMREKMKKRPWLSGRWILTVACAIVFVGMSLSGMLPPDDAKAIILVVATFYFSKPNGKVS